MTLHDRLVILGKHLFRWRSYTPLIIIVLFVFEKDRFHFPFGSAAWNTIYELGCFFISLSGEFMRIMTTGYVPRGTSGRNVRGQAAEVLNTTGMYSITRNPLYLGNYTIVLGITLWSQSWELVIINTLLFIVAYTSIILTEEDFLHEKFGDTYNRYRDEVPCFFPRISLWKRNENRWNWKMFLRREPDSIMAVVFTSFLVEQFRIFTINGKITISWLWFLLAGVIAALWIIAKILKKLTRLLKIQPYSGS